MQTDAKTTSGYAPALVNKCAPRWRGDDPEVLDAREVIEECSPLARG